MKLKLFNMFNNKRGQVYIFIAILLIAFAFNISRPQTLAGPKADAFRELHQNFDTESEIVINNALYRNVNVSEAYIAFTGDYFDYARTKSPKFRFLYLLKDDDSLLIGNELGLSVKVSVSNTSYNLTHDSKLTITPQTVTIDLEGLKYDFIFTSETYQIKALFRQKTLEGRRVFVNN